MFHENAPVDTIEHGRIKIKGLYPGVHILGLYGYSPVTFVKAVNQDRFLKYLLDNGKFTIKVNYCRFLKDGVLYKPKIGLQLGKYTITKSVFDKEQYYMVKSVQGLIRLDEGVVVSYVR